ncbi:MAG: glycosyl transferase family 2 [Conexibacter sp.]|jgi:glycosyltransferase involved in cell wall biosynthesis|nr:glycosyl transferase family 2 [Conexibacter sp.]
MSSQPDISVLVPVLNEETHIRETVAAMQSQELGDRTLELVFADGRSDDRTKQILEQMAQDDDRIVVVDNPARTTAAGLNAALGHARGQYVARMDAHAFFPPRYLAAGIERLERGDDVVWVAGPVVPRGNGGVSSGVALALGTRLGVGASKKWRMNDPNARASDEIELDTGVFAGVWRRETVDRLGGWDADWPVNQDSELAARVHAEGGRIICLPEMAAEYIPRDRLKTLWRQYWRHGFYRAKTGSRHPTSLRRTHLLPPSVVATAALSIAGPRPLRRLGRVGLVTYGGALAAASLAEARNAPPRHAALLPPVLATMHLAWGIGFITGLARFGTPWAAILRLLSSR